MKYCMKKLMRNVVFRASGMQTNKHLSRA